MKRWGLVLLGMVMIFGLPVWVAGTESQARRGKLGGTARSRKRRQAIWAGKSGGFEIRWTDSDIQVHPLKSPNRVVFSARSLARTRICPL